MRALSLVAGGRPPATGPQRGPKAWAWLEGLSVFPERLTAYVASVQNYTSYIYIHMFRHIYMYICASTHTHLSVYLFQSKICTHLLLALLQLLSMLTAYYLLLATCHILLTAYHSVLSSH